MWAGYFDEGAYGNYGWGEPDTPPPMGQHGLVRFSSDLQPEWNFPSNVENPWGAISDCYALNIDGDTAWTCYHTDFPIVRVGDGAVRGWHNTIIGIKALAVSESCAALLGGYGPDRDRLAVGTFGNEDFHLSGEYRLVLPDGQPLPPKSQMIGRGPDLHLLTGDDWYRLDLEDLPPEPAK